MSTELATVQRNGTGAMLVADVLAQEGEQRNLLGEFVAKHMTENSDYGVIPGTKNKTLLKPGAEKLTTIFRCVPRFVIEEKIENWESGLFYYRFSCHIVTLADGNVVAEGVGSCSTYESRYRWRTANRVCPACGADAILRSKHPPRDNPHAAPGWFCWNKKGGCGANFAADDIAVTGQASGRVQNPDLCDCANTVLKMAKKRAHVDAAIALARCSDIFTQDVEDFSEAPREEPQQNNRNGQTDLRNIPGVKSGADLKPPRNFEAEFAACGTLPDLQRLWVSLTLDQKRQAAAAKDLRKDQLAVSASEGDDRSDPSKSAIGAGRTSTMAATATKTPSDCRSTDSEGEQRSDPTTTGAATARTSKPRLPKPSNTYPTVDELVKLVETVAKINGEDEAVLFGLACNVVDAPDLMELTDHERVRVDDWLRNRAHQHNTVTSGAP